MTLTLSSTRARLLTCAALLMAAPALIAAMRPLHFALERSAPADKAVVTSISEIRLWFTEEPMDMGQSTVSVRLLDADKELVPTGNAVLDPQDAKVYSLALPSGLAPQTYTVAWRGMGDDGHVVRGEFTFTVGTP